ncbi:MAG TPA: DUF4157 domain-containing protein [Ferruginibacter sp.]|nr:DUF4157 domain-containing protein [Ferruginibacter sp.]HRO16933.1 DUF4157 domain-containing protein [Ferruginibacter sp.]HRQ20604.1 DUF4157 domain-containing protein [Ferruginibacter sp.]
MSKHRKYMQLEGIDFSIRESSFPARIAAYNLKARKVAIVFGNTIHLYGTTSSEFLENTAWVKHELCHIRQYKQYGFIGFIVRYLLESLRTGYYNNRFEVEARAAEQL